MRVFHIITSLKIGGAESALVNLLATLTKMKQSRHEVAYFYSGPNITKIENIGIKAHNVRGSIYRYDLGSYLKLVRLIKKFDPHVLHSSLWVANIIGRLLSVHLKIPLLCDLHGDSRFEGKIRNIFDRATCGIPQKIIAVSAHVAQAYVANILKKRYSNRLARNKVNDVEIIKNGINLADIVFDDAKAEKSKRIVDVKSDTFVIGAVGRLEKIKSFDVLIKAFSLFVRNKSSERGIKNTVLVLVGDGSQMMTLQNLAKQLEIHKAIIFMGERANVTSLYSCFDCFAMSSQSEGISIAMLEAMASGLPIVMTTNEQKQHVLKNNVNGLLVSVNDIKGLAQALEVLYRDHDLRRKMGIENRQTAIKDYDISRVANRYLTFYQREKRAY